MYKAIAMGARHAGIDLRDNDLSRLYRRLRNVNRRSQRAITMRIGRRYLYQRHVDRQDIPAEELRYLAEEDGHVVAIIAVHHRTRIRGNE